MEKKMYLYETHLHTFPVSRCAKAGVRESLEFYSALGYDGVFVTNHFLDGNINIDRSLPYNERLDFYFSDFYEAKKVGEELGMLVFLGVEMSDWGTDFLVYGLDAEWYYKHPEIEGMERTKQLSFLADSGALIIHAHPFRSYDCIKLFPRFVHGVEIYNASRTDFENEMAKRYAESYNLRAFAGTDNHIAEKQKRLGGIATERKITCEQDFCDAFLFGGGADFFAL